MAPGYSSNNLDMQPEIRAQAEAAAQRAGMPVEHWLDEAIRQIARTPGRPYGAGSDASHHMRERMRPERPGEDSLADLATRLEELAAGGSDTALGRTAGAGWYRHSDFTEPPRHDSLRDSLDAGPLRAMERTIRAIVDHVQVADRRNADALRHIQSQIQRLVQRAEHAPAAAPAGAGVLSQIERRLEALAERIEQIDSARPEPDIAGLEKRLTALAAAFDHHAAAQKPAPAPAAGTEPGDYMSDFMRRQERRRREAAGATATGDAPAAGAEETPPWRREAAALKQDAEAAIKAQAGAIEAQMSRRFDELARDLRAMLGKPPAPPPELAEMQNVVQNLAGRFEEFVRQPAAAPDDARLRQELRALSQRLAAAEERFATLGSLDATFARLFERIDEAERQIRQAAETPKTDPSIADKQFATLFARLEESREAMIEAARCAAAETAEDAAGAAAREAAQASVRQAQEAAVAAAREAARAYLAEQAPAAPAQDVRIVAALQDSLQRLREDVDGADRRTEEMLASVEETLRAMSGRLARIERGASPAEPAAVAPAPSPVPAPEPEPEPGDEADSRIEPQFSSGAPDRAAAADIPAPLAELRLPALEVPPFRAPFAGTADAAGTGPRPADMDEDDGGGDNEGAAGLNRPREPGDGPPRAILERLAREFGDARTASPAAAADTAAKTETAAPAAAAETSPRENGRDPAQALRSARTTNELLAAARRAAQAASEQAASQPGKARQSLRERLRIPRSPLSRGAAAAAPSGKSAAPSGKPAPASAGKGQPAARKPIVLAVAAVLLLAGSVEIYKFIKHRAPGLLPGGSTQIEEPASVPPAGTDGPASHAPGGMQERSDNARPDSGGTMEHGSLLAPPASLPADAAQTPTGAIGDPAMRAPSPLTFAKATPDAAQDTGAPAAGEETRATAGSLPPIPADLGPAALRQAALAGDPVAQFEIASRLAEGRGTAPDPAAALAWYQRAAASGLAPAQYRLGSMHEKGVGTGRDIDKARVWYERAAEQGNRKAMHNLAVLHTDGFGGQPDFQSAARWFRAAADLGLADSQYNLGILHVRGLGVPQNFIEAYKWFAIVAARGDRDAATRRDAIAGKLGAPDLAAAKLAVQTWKAKPLDAEANAVRLPNTGWQQGEPRTEAAAAGSAPGPDIVRNAQKLLAALGYEPGPADGMTGPRTREAVRSFQEHSGIAPTGEITPDLIRKLQQTAG